LGICSWFLQFAPFGGADDSFTGNATVYTISGDLPSSSFAQPSMTLSGSGGSDILYLYSGTYLIQFNLYCGAESINEVNILPNCTLTSITIISSSANASMSEAEVYFTSYAIVKSTGGSIAFPIGTALSSLYGSNWSESFCNQFYIARLS